ncbi:aspartate--ammonia ligase [Lactobacillus sp. ESL0236]|uniref:aspartate--ammonia ligase n=1 Tax=unclassified Lactobacillus TaxID=2620435 RepID=UPI000EFACE08|nr:MULTISPECIES: aspartate--ammonia ligase [unclassified Lactobacillus]RMC41982.1 aspartate--ammonia ligase [Lactobacillus sp. ESL0237]RMC45589.1 aspartate--ammonia ligase [Lactobacillus sp. ESL0234]RMC46976.1 aspartate--ammonia ligase [Lactobacillus sp. ESL0236]
MTLIMPQNYQPTLTIRDTEAAIVFIRERFQVLLGQKLNLQRMSAPLFVEKNTGLNDNLNGIERPVNFDVKAFPKDDTIEIVHSLAKWKRLALKKYHFGMHEGLYTNMNAIRRDEDLDNFHSIYVDQWDWEKIIAEDERTITTLTETVAQIFRVIKQVETECATRYPASTYHLPDDIFFITTQELEDRWPDLSPEERENKIAEQKKAVFLMKIGDNLARSGKPHDGRAPDYDDWQLNGDLIFWYEPLKQKLEISSMGIRVSPQSLHKQLIQAHCLAREQLNFHQMLLNGELPFTIGGGIGQSRLCMLLLGKAHIGEVQASIWPKEMLKMCQAHNIQIL